MEQVGLEENWCEKTETVLYQTR